MELPSEFTPDKKPPLQSDQACPLSHPIEIQTLVKQLGSKLITRAEVNRLTTHVLPNVKNCQNIVWESKPTLSVTQVRTSMREVILFLFK